MGRVHRPAMRSMTTSSATLAALRCGELEGITRLDLACGLEAFPREIFELADSLEVLNLSGNSLTARSPSGAGTSECER